MRKMPKTYGPDHPSVESRDLRELYHESARRWEGKPAHRVRRKPGEPAIPRSSGSSPTKSTRSARLRTTAQRPRGRP